MCRSFRNLKRNYSVKFLTVYTGPTTSFLKFAKSIWAVYSPPSCVCVILTAAHTAHPPPPSHSLLYLTFTSPASPALERLWHLHTALSSVFCKLSWVFFKQHCTGDTDAPQASSVRMHSSRFSQRVSLEIVFNTKTQLFWVEMAR